MSLNSTITDMKYQIIETEKQVMQCPKYKPALQAEIDKFVQNAKKLMGRKITEYKVACILAPLLNELNELNELKILE